MASQSKLARAHSSRVPLGLLLLSREILTSEQLKLALAHQQLAGVDFGVAAQQLGFATQEQVTAAVAAQWACPVFSLGDRPPQVQVRIPRLLIETYEMLPVHYAENERHLMIGFVRNVQHQLLYTIKHITSCAVAPCFITAREYALYLNARSAQSPDDQELVVDQISGSAEMARVTANYVDQLAVDRMRLGKCRDYVWARLWGRKRETDLLFRVRTD